MPRENSLDDSPGRSLTPDLPDVNDTVPPTEPQSASPTSADVLHETQPRRPTFPGSPGDRLRASVRKVIQMHRTSSIIMRHEGVGAEPGIDPRRESAILNYGHIRQKCEIEVTDYSATSRKATKVSNAELVEMMKTGTVEREPWVKVRWINIGGISWDVMSALSVKYHLHPLALEDVLVNNGLARSKADYYRRHLALRILCHSVGDTSTDHSADNEVDVSPPRSSSPEPMHKDEEEGAEDLEKTVVFTSSAPASRFSTKRRKFGGAKDVEATTSSPQSTLSLKHPRRTLSVMRRAHWDENQVINTLKQGERVNVKIAPMHIFLTRDGTVISVHPTQNLAYTAPIASRLTQKDTLLRLTADPSLLVQSLLDLIVDSALEVVEEYHSKLLTLERAILLKPKMRTVRDLHVMSGDLILHKRTLEPIKTLVYGLRRYDLDRCAALIDPDDVDPATGKPPKAQGYMSMKANVYLADVVDHMDQVLTSLDMFDAIAENLINFTFNMVSADMNDTMRRLTVATIIFLPLTLLTGYFGMNFTHMWSVLRPGASDLLFWELALPMIFFVILLFMRSDIIGLVHYVQKRMLVKKEIQNFGKKSP